MTQWLAPTAHSKKFLVSFCEAFACSPCSGVLNNGKKKTSDKFKT